MPFLVKLTLFASGEPIMANVSLVQTVSPMKELNGCTLIFTDGRKIAVKETMEQIYQKVCDFVECM